MTTLEKLTKGLKENGNIASEDFNDKEYLASILISIGEIEEIMNDAEIDLAIYSNLNTNMMSDYWNEVRYNDTVIDHDAPHELTLKEWAEYLDRMIAESKKYKINFDDYQMLAQENKAMTEFLERLNEQNNMYARAALIYFFAFLLFLGLFTITIVKLINN